MALEDYRARRDFTATGEPRGTRRGRRGRSYVIQEHAARRLHYDLRLEMDGVLKSWAVTRGPSLVAGEKRLAVQVEDHPLEYADFEGTIPRGAYGGGAVIVWDRGRWKPVGDAGKGYAKGHLEFELAGEKLAGRWHLVRMAAKPREKRGNWLLIKADDDAARGPGAPDILEERPGSVLSGRTVEEVADEPRRRSSEPAPAPPKGGRAAPWPGFVEPALATLKPTAPSGSRWVHEIKLDGYRLQAHVRGGEARLLTRRGLDWTGRFGKAVPAAIAALPAREAIIDGELVVETPPGGSDFAALQADLGEGRSDRFLFCAFDLLYLDGVDLRGAALLDRKARLKALLGNGGAPLRYSEHFEEQGDIVLAHACRLSLEGVVSKLAAAPYRSGRTGDWIKSKCADRQEFVVAGYVPSTVSDTAIGALVLGHWNGGRLLYAGRVGTGFSDRVAHDLYARLEPLKRADPPFAGRLSAEARRGVRFVEPELVAEVEFRAWTADGVLRHASFRGLREDKPASAVVREEPGGRAGPRPASAVKLTHPDRLYWEEAGVTKAGLADYYSEVWRWMAPHVVGRPLALVRCPEGAARQCFMQKHAWRGMNRHIQTARDPLAKGEDGLVAIGDLDGLIGLVQGAALEVHAWQAPLGDLERPDQIVMDLDPGEGVPWERVIAAAVEVRERLEAAGLAAFVKTTGGKGLHVVAPLAPAAGWDAVMGFARDLAGAMAADAPDAFVATVAKARRKGRILIDYLRNARGSIAVAPYSSRARAGAPVSMPLAWEELAPGIGSARFTVGNAPARMLNLAADPWAAFDDRRAPLPGFAGTHRAG